MRTRHLLQCLHFPFIAAAPLHCLKTFKTSKQSIKYLASANNFDPADAISASTTDEILSELTEGLTLDMPISNFTGLKQISERHPELVRNFIRTRKGSSLLSKLLFLSKSLDEAFSV